MITIRLNDSRQMRSALRDLAIHCVDDNAVHAESEGDVDLETAYREINDAITEALTT